MILCRELKVCLFLVPRTGTTTLRRLFDGAPVLTNTALNLLPHPNYPLVLQQVPDLPSYRMFAFYRDPVERFVSAFNYMKQRCARHPKKGPCFESFETYIKSKYFEYRGQRISILRPQVYWLDHPGIEWLDFTRYEDEVAKVLKAFRRPAPAVIERHNESAPVWSPTDEQRACIAQIYHDDYSFLKGEDDGTYK